MEEGGGHGFLFLVVVLEEGEGEEEEGFFFLLLVLLFVFLLVGWLVVGWGAFLCLLLKVGNFLVSTFSYHAECGYAFFFFLFFSLSFFLVELEGRWLDYASPGRAD